MSDAFLGVAKSFTGRRWVGPTPAIERAAQMIAQATGQPELVARQLAVAGVEAEDAADYLAPTLRALMPDPSTLTDMDAAADRVVAAVQARERIAIFGDYDVDGGASVALLAGWLSQLGLDSTPYIPDRIDEGYGPNVPAMTDLAGGHDLILCVDCGTLSHEPIDAARGAGADVVVVDHHLPGERLPDAVVVNPNRADDSSGQGHLCAAGVVFLLLVACNRLLRLQGAFEGRTEPDLRMALDLVAVASVADVAPMIGLNRAFVRQGLAIMAQRQRPGLVALADVSKLSAPPRAADLGFAIGPRINAGGRIGAADLGARLLMAVDPDEARALADRLDDLNRERRTIEAAVLEAATEQAEARGVDGPLVWAAGPGWHPGVVGIVASRLKDKFNRPAVVIGLDGDEGKGSGRSITGIDLGAAVADVTSRGFLLKGGGHRMAAGLSVAPGKLEPAMDALAAALAAQGAADQGARDLILLGALNPGGAAPDLVEHLDAAGPFGPANPAPRIAFPDAVPSGVRIVGNGHAQFRLSAGGPPLDAIAFNAADQGSADLLQSAASARRPLHLAG
ncbi:MAG: single-stranded-DNA-specific exonuclease RecJ, partial [Pseudomonadota bacterium]